MIEEHSKSQMAYFGALGFTNPAEELEFQMVPLQTILFWLSRPLGTNLVEPQTPVPNLRSAVPYRALAIAVTKEMLYGEGGPLVWIGVVYKPAYILPLGYSITYMCLNEWHSTSLIEGSEGHLQGPRLLFVGINEDSGLFPVPAGHPILLDTMAKEVQFDLEGCVSPLRLRGFRLHSLYTKFPDGRQIQQVIFPRLLGGLEAILVTYEKERFPSALENHPKMMMDLHPPVEDHWNIASDGVLPVTMEEFWCVTGTQGASSG